MTQIPGSKCGFLVCRLLPPTTTGEAGIHPLCQVWSQGGTFSHFLQFCFLQHFLGNFSNSQMGKADSLRSSKKPVASEGLSMFVVNWCFYISPSKFIHISLVCFRPNHEWVSSQSLRRGTTLSAETSKHMLFPSRSDFILSRYIWNTYPNNKISAIGELMINSVWNVKFDI